LSIEVINLKASRQDAKELFTHPLFLVMSLLDTMRCFFHYDWQQTPKLLEAEQLQA